jgi:putative sterol carrier protein
MQLFDALWSQAWAREIDASETYRRVGSDWDSPIVLELRDGETTRAVIAHLSLGRCRSAQPATPQDRQSAPFLLSGDAASWERLLAGKLDPMFALITGKLRLERGALGALIPHAAAAKELVAAAVRVRQAHATG